MDKPMMEQQMELFRRGGLNDEGGEIDEVSGNEVPVGGTKKGVRDDVPAMVSEGEFVFPEDVVRYIGLDKLMQLRQQAKMGLKTMEAMGQMGNGDEATIPDDLPFDMADLIIVAGDTGEELEMQEGGFVRRPTTVTRTAQQPTYAQPSIPVLPPEQPVFRSVRSLTPQIERPAPSVINFDKLMGDARINFKEYRNASGQSILIPFLGDSPIFPIPEGYSLYQPSTEETPTEEQEVVEEVNEALANAPRDSSESRSSSAIVRNEFTEAGSWEGVPLDMYIKEATKFVDGTSSLATGVMGAFAGLPMGLFTRVAASDQKKRILATIDKRIQEAMGTPVEGQVAQLRKIKAILEGKEAPAGAFDKVKSIVKGILAPEEVKQQTVKVAANSPVKMETPESDAALAEQVKQLSGPAAAEATFGAPLGDPLGGTPPPVDELVFTPTPTTVPVGRDIDVAFDPTPVVADPLAPLPNLDDRDAMRETQATGIMFAGDEDRPSGKTAFNVIPDLSQDPAYANTILPTGMGGMLRDGSAQPIDPNARLKENQKQRRAARIQAEDPIAKRAKLASVYQTPSVVAGQPVVTPPTPVSYELPDELTIPAFTQPTPTVAPTTETPTVSQIDYTDIQTSGPPSVPDSIRTPLGTAAAASRREQEATLPTTPTVQDQMATAIPTTIVDSRIDVSRQPTIEAPDPRLDVSRQPTIEAPYPTQPVTTTASYGPPSVSSAELGGDPSIDFSQPTVDPRPAIAFDPSTSAGDPAISGISQATSLAPDVSLRPQARPAEVVAEQPVTTPKPKEDKPKSGLDFNPATSQFKTKYERDEALQGSLGNVAQTAAVQEVHQQGLAAKGISDKKDKPATTTTKTSKDTNVASSGRTEADIQKEINAEIKKAGKDGWNDKLNDLVKERDSARANEGSSGGGGGSDSGGSSSGGSCCFIMLEARYGNGTMDKVVRRYRDEHMTDRNRRGYYKVAEVLVPLMRKSPVIKWIVTKTFADPLVSYGKYYYGQNKHGILFAPAKNLWMKLFDIVGGDTEFIRENGETV